MAQTQVLIVGAGPSGLVLAFWLRRHGVRVRIVDKTAEPGTTSRALAVQARTLELYRQAGVADAVTAGGHQVPAANMWVKGRRRARFPLQAIGKGQTPFPFLLVYPQDEHERMLIDRLGEVGVEVERRTELISFEDTGEAIRAKLRHADGGEETCEAAYLAGCDGARSVVREGIGAGFPGGTYEHLFYVADVQASGPTLNGELHIDLDTADFLAVFPLKGEGRARLIGTVRGERAARAESLTFADVSDQAIGSLKVKVERVNWFSTYHVHHRVAASFRKGRAFLVGDAAHIHSPAGGQGMNTGIGDAINLAWKLAWVLAGRAPQALLDSYQEERIGFARRLVATTDQAFMAVSATGAWARFIRTRVAPRVAPLLIKLSAVRRFMFRTVSQTAIEYRGMSLSAGVAGEVHGGDRPPWVELAGGDNYAALDQRHWRVQVYGRANPALSAWCEAKGVGLDAMPWTPACGRVGYAQDAAYLLRPDGYVAFADPKADPEAVARYFSDRGLTPA